MNKKQIQHIRFRIIFIGICFVLFFSALMVRAFDLQVLQHDELSAYAKRESMRQVQFSSRRGVILDRNQEELAVTLDTDSIFARPMQVEEPALAGAQLAAVLEQEPDKLINRLSGEKNFVWLARQVSPDKAKAVMEMDLQGIGVNVEPKRFYPYSSLACHVLGFTGTDSKGLEGLEVRYNSELEGTGRSAERMRDALGRTIAFNTEDFSNLPEGNNLILTIDKHLQYQVEKILASTVARYRATGGQAVVMVPHSGEILAMASVPSFNPNNFASFPATNFRNRVVSDTYEPGSTFKMFVVAAALNQRIIPRTQRFFCENGKWQLAGRQIRDTHPYGDLTMAEIIKYSSNIGSAKLGQAIGVEELNKTFAAFGFGQPTGIDLPGEGKGVLRRLSNNRPVDLANVCFGQGLSLTSIQLVSAVAAIANGGVLMRPYIVKAITDSQAQLVHEQTPTVVNRVMEPGTARLLTAMLCTVTETGGTGANIKVDGVRVAGKTGTAQKAVVGGYSKTDYIASFVGYLPADNPEFVILVLIDSPRGNYYGGVVAGPAWSAIAKAAMERLGHFQPQMVSNQTEDAGFLFVTPDPEPSLQQGIMPDLRGLSLRQVLTLAGRQGVEVTANGFGRVVGQKPSAGSSLAGPWNIELAPSEGGA